jgi:hypothetical protein
VDFEIGIGSKYFSTNLMDIGSNYYSTKGEERV